MVLESNGSDVIIIVVFIAVVAAVVIHQQETLPVTHPRVTITML
jgi:hypothetical protein